MSDGLFKILVLIDLLAEVPSLIVFFAASFFVFFFKNNLFFYFGVFLSFFLASFLIHCLSMYFSLKLYELKKSKLLLFLRTVIVCFVNSIAHFVAFYIFSNLLLLVLSNKISIFDLILVTGFIALFSIVINIFFVFPIYFKKVKNIFCTFVARPDLKERFQETIDALNLKVSFSHLKNGFFNLPNAMAILTTNEIIVIGPLEEILTREEFESIILHELAHLKKKKIFLAKGLILFVMLFVTAYIYYIVRIDLSNFLKTQVLLLDIIFALVSMLLFFVVSKKVQRQNEKDADDLVKQFVNTETYSNALIKIYKNNKIPENFGKLKYLMSHPELKKRTKQFEPPET